MTRLSTIVEILKILITNFINKNPINCILLHKFSRFSLILIISTIFSTFLLEKLTISKNTLVTLGQWETGKKLFEIIQNQTLSNGTTGRVGFDEMGDRIYAEYQIVNVQMNTKSKNKMTVGYYNYSKVSLQFLK